MVHFLQIFQQSYCLRLSSPNAFYTSCPSKLNEEIVPRREKEVKAPCFETTQSVVTLKVSFICTL
jgi:hypothetical protein